MEQGKAHLFSDVASVNNGGNSLLGQRLDSLMLNPIFRNIIRRYKNFMMILETNMLGN